MKNVILYFFLVPVFLFAQEKENDTINVKASLSLTGFYQGGNVETLIFRANSDFSFKPFKNGLFETRNSYVYQEFGKQKADEDILSLNFLRFNTIRKISPLLLGFVSTNFRREIDIRYLFGAGATFQVYSKKKDWLKFSLTCEYENTEFKQSNFNKDEFDGNETINTYRGTLWVSGKYHLFKNKVILSHESYIQPSLERRNNFRWRADVSLEIPVWKFLNFKINYLDSFESVVIQDQRQEDSVMSVGFTVKTY
ncbi:MAG: DUF481 domain-containing protein [Bacteroidia bacterium]|nr:DUF481 domain-containing protein [Bacteroidia bacterium]